MIPGSGRVHGVILTLEDIELALPALDALEGCHLTPSEYKRVVVTAQPLGQRAWTYVYVNQTRLAAGGVSPVAEGDWPLQ
jgi:gamma-glutamylcyclotransferase (GGCT)/AIG2-like uncharacterized protein YtfP